MKLFGRVSAEQPRRSAVAPRQRVEIKVRGAGRSAGHVDVVEDGSVLIALVVAAATDLPDVDEAEAVLEYTADRGLYRQRGSARYEQEDSVRFIPSAEPELVQRRDFVRVDVTLPVRISLKDNPDPIERTVLNLSANGIVLATQSDDAPPLDVGTFVWLEIGPVDGEDLIEARGSVVRELGRGRTGIRFDHIAEQHQERLARFVARQERDQRKGGL